MKPSRRETGWLFVIYCLNNLKNVVFSCFFLRIILRITYYFTTFVIRKRNNNKKQKL